MGHAPTPSERKLAAQIAANESWAQTEDRSERTRPAREALFRKFEREVDPEGKLPPAERARRAEHRRRAHFQRLALKSAQSRRRAKEAIQTAVAAEAELARLQDAGGAA